MDERMQRCIDDCLACYQSCTKTIMHCLKLGGDHAAPAHIRLLMDCAEICKTSAGFMLRDSNHIADVCSICIDICESCAADCEDMMGSDEAMKECAAMCRKCAASCREIAHRV